MKRVVVTGAAGFIGPWVCRAFQQRGWHVIAAVRHQPVTPLPANETMTTGDLGRRTDWRPFPANASCVVHLAARAHRIDESVSDPLAEYRRENVETTRRLAVAARDAGVRRFIFLSSVKALGEERETPYSERDVPAPVTPYGVSKLEAENALRETHGLEPVILRPTFVYGPGAKGNAPRLVQLARIGAYVPLPIGSVRNRRSVLFVRNLADAIVRCAESEKAVGETYMVADAEAPSTRELLAKVAAALGTRLMTFPFPVAALQALASLGGFTEEARRLLASLVVDTMKIETQLGWRRPFSIDEGLRAMVDRV